MNEMAFPDTITYFWIGFSKQADGVNFRRVIDGKLANPNSPQRLDPNSNGWFPGYPNPGSLADYIMMYHNKQNYDHGLLWNGVNEHNYGFVCEY